MTSHRAVFVSRLGGPEVLEVRPIAPPEAGEGQVVVEHTAIGVNFVDIYLRSGQPHSHNPTPPFVPGVNAVGRVVALGRGAAGVEVGDRVTFTNTGNGTYATHTAQPADRLVKLPQGLDDTVVAAGFVRAMTAQYLLRQIRPMRAGETVLVHAAAGTAGQLLVQWAKRLGLVVIGTAGSDERVALARELGADCGINYRSEDFVAQTMRFTDGAGVQVVFDSVGHDTFYGSLACLAPRGLVINYGTASGQVEGFALQDLHARSLSVCRPTLKTFIARREDLLSMAREAFDFLADPTVRVGIDRVLPLDQARTAHELLEGRTLNGSIVLVP